MPEFPSGDYRSSNRHAAHPVQRSLSDRAGEWLFGLPAVVILLVAIIGVGCYGVWWVATKVVPSHIASFQASIREVQALNDKRYEMQEASHKEERQRSEDSSRFERSEWRKFHTEEMNRWERFGGGRKINTLPPVFETEPPAISKKQAKTFDPLVIIEENGRFN